jgi:hypothetical protein
LTEWTKILTHPLGLVGFVLFLVFGLIAKIKSRDEKRWLFGALLGMSGVALLGGLCLAYVELNHQAATAAQPVPSSTPVQVVQKSSGAASPNVQDVKGNVAITVDQSAGTKAPGAAAQTASETKTPHQKE